MFLTNEFSTYHFETKHSYYSVRSNPNRLDWDNQPAVFKTYEGFEKIKLDMDCENHSFLFHIAGLNSKKVYPTAEYYLRMNPSAGALYPNEIYFQSRNNDGIKNGIYHFDIKSSSITLLKEIKEEGIEKNLFLKNQFDGFIILISSIYYRSSWKYKDRAFRYCLLDSGHILGSAEASSYLHNKEYQILYDFKKKKLNELFNFDKKEFFQAALLLGVQTEQKSKKVELELPLIDVSASFEKNKLIEQTYENTLTVYNPRTEINQPYFFYNKSFFKDVIFQRRSIRGFSNQYIKADEFKKIMKILNNPIPSDCDEDIDIYAVINRVQGMPLGLYKDGAYIKEGDFQKKAGYLCLEQDLGSTSAVTFFLVSKSNNYQAVYQKAGIIGHRLYLAANYLGYGCTGIGAYYDDEVCEFIEDNTMVLYALAIGN